MANWYWPGEDDVNDFPDPLGFEGEWNEWSGTMHDGPPVFAEIFAREYVQNSWDAIQEKLFPPEGPTSDLRPSISFRFVRLEGRAAEEFAAAFGLGEFRSAAEKIPTVELDQRLRLAKDSWVRTEEEAIDLLVACESGGAGMHGSWENANKASAPPARMKYALVRSTSGKIGKDTGGSWGKGKLGVANASKSRILAAYSCHPKEGMAPHVSRRFMGAAYWQQHDFDEFRRAGLGLLGGTVPRPEQKFSEFRPFQDSEADGFIEALKVPGLGVRDPEESKDHGTSYLLVDPAFGAEELAAALARNWWPLLGRDLVDIEVIDRDGNSVDVSPLAVPVLRPFLEAEGLDAGSSDELSEVASIQVMGRKAGEFKVHCSEEDGWSYEELEGDRKNTDLVALVRNDMVIAYQQYPQVVASRSAPYVRGVFQVSDDASVRRDLKLVEGHLHNSWTRGTATADPELLSFAKKVVDAVGDGVKELRSRLADDDTESDGRVRLFDELLTLSGSRPGPKPPPPPPPPRPWTIQGASGSSIVASDDDPALIMAKGQVQIGLRPDLDVDELEVIVELGWGVIEKTQSPNWDSSLFDAESIEFPASFELDEDGLLTGVLTKQPVWFHWGSTWFPNDWKVAPYPRVKRKDGGEE